MSHPILIDLLTASECVALLATLQARILTVSVTGAPYRPLISLAQIGELPAYLDAERMTVTDLDGARCVVLRGCLITWVSEER